MLDMEYFEIRSVQAGITVTEQEIRDEVNMIRSQLIPLKQFDEDRSLLQRALDAMGTVKEDQAFELALQQRAGLTVAKLTQLKKQEILARKYVTQLLESAQSEILDEKGLIASDIRTEIENGREFIDAAKEYSDHEDSKNIGGLVPLIKHDDARLPPQIIDNAFTLPVGEISSPILVANPPESAGAWLVTVVNRKEASGEEWESQKETLRQTLLDEKRRMAESGEIPMPEDGNITVSDDELINNYEEVSVRVIFLKGEDPMQRVTERVQADIDTMNIEIYDPELRATHHISKHEYNEALRAYYESLEKIRGRYDPKNPESIINIELGEARIRYLIANMWTNISAIMEQEFFSKAYERFMADPEAFGGDFPTLPDNLKSKMQGMYVTALLNLEKAIELDELDPWSHYQRAQIDLTREQISPRLVEDLTMLHEYFQGSLELENQLQSFIERAISLDDAALEQAGGVRPETWTYPVLPEEEMGLTIEAIESQYSLKDSEVSAEMPIETVVDETEQPQETPDETESDEPENELIDEIADLVIENESEPVQDTPQPAVDAPETIDETLEGLYIPEVKIAEPSGPLTEEDRNNLQELLDDVRVVIDYLNKRREEMQAAQDEYMRMQTEDLQPVEPPSEDASNLIVGE